MRQVKWVVVTWGVGILLLAGCGARGAEPSVESTAAAPTVTASEESAVASAPTEAATAADVAQATDTPVAESVPATPAPVAEQPAGADDASFAVPDWYAFAATYSDEHVGFALRYPADWNVLDVSPEVRENSTNYAVTINSWDAVDGGSGGIPTGQTKLDVLVMRSDAANVEEAATQRRRELTENEPSTQIVEEEMWTLEDGLQAQRWTIQGEQQTSYEVIAVFDGWTVILAGLGDEQRFDEVARSLHPLPE